MKNLKRRVTRLLVLAGLLSLSPAAVAQDTDRTDAQMTNTPQHREPTRWFS